MPWRNSIDIWGDIGLNVASGGYIFGVQAITGNALDSPVTWMVGLSIVVLNIARAIKALRNK